MTPTQSYDYKIQRPLLAADIKDAANLEKLRYPLYASYKIDGIRCLTLDSGFVVSRSFKPIPNAFANRLLQQVPLYLDGELIALDTNGKAKNFNDTSGEIMSRGGQPMLQYIVFDSFEHPEHDFQTRSWHASVEVERYNASVVGSPLTVTYLHHFIVTCGEDVIERFNHAVELGYEGIMLRDPAGIYKSGRSTLKQQILLKYKGLENSDAEGTVIGFEELYRNQNEQERDAFGLAKRSSHKANKIAAGILGSLVLQTRWGVLCLGTGFTLEQREEIWKNREQYYGKLVTFTYQGSGMKDLPRFPAFKGFRHHEDT